MLRKSISLKFQLDLLVLNATNGSGQEITKSVLARAENREVQEIQTVFSVTIGNRACVHVYVKRGYIFTAL